MRSFCLLTSMEKIHIPNCSLLYLHSNGMNSLKRSYTLNIIVIKKTHKLSQGSKGQSVNGNVSSCT